MVAENRFWLMCRTNLRSAVLAIVIGVTFGLLITLGRPDADYFASIVVGALTGFLIWLDIMLTIALFKPTLEKLSDRQRQIAYVTILTLAGSSGWVIGVYLGNKIFGGTATLWQVMHHGSGTFMLTTAAIVVVVGLLVRSFEAMRDRLEATMERLKEREWAEKELELARAIQTRLLPPPWIEGHGFSIAARNFPAHLVAGDFYDVVQHEDGSVAIVVADVAGKGIGASLIMASVKAVLPFVGRGTVEEAMTSLNEKLVQELDRREFVALAYARFFPADGTLQLANAGFPDPYLIRAKSVKPLTVGGMRLPLGIRSNAAYQTLTTKLEPSDRLVFVSDGIPEAPVEGDQPLGYERLAEALRDGSHERADDWLEEFLTRIRREVREPLSDDWTALVLQFTAGARIAA